MEYIEEPARRADQMDGNVLTDGATIQIGKEKPELVSLTLARTRGNGFHGAENTSIGAPDFYFQGAGALRPRFQRKTATPGEGDVAEGDISTSGDTGDHASLVQIILTDGLGSVVEKVGALAAGAQLDRGRW